MKKLLCLLLAILLVTGCSSPSGEKEPEGGTSGTFTGVAGGMNGEVKVDVTFTDSKITDVKIGSNSETPGVSDAALNTLPGLIVTNQSTAVDNMAGATISSVAVKNAVNDAIEQAGLSKDDFGTKVVATVRNAELTNDALPTEWDETYDVVVVGGGFAGLAAAQSAAAEGATVGLFEKNANVGGNSATNGGQYAAYTSDKAEQVYASANVEPDTAEQHIQDTIKGGDNLPNPELVKVMVHGSPIYFNRLLENGLVIRDMIARPGGHYGYRTYVTENQIGADITIVQTEMVKNAGVDVSTDAKMVQLYQDETKKVVGVQVATLEGNKNIKANKGVIIATGGFSSNVEMRDEYNTIWETLDSSVPTTNNGSSTGEGLSMAIAAGAATVDMGLIQLYPFADPNNGILDNTAVIPFTGPSYGIVYVDQNGARYVDEGERRDVNAKAMMDTGATTTFSILTRELASWVTDSDFEKGIAKGRIIKGETLEELAANLNALKFKGESVSVDAKTLEESIARHNGFIDSQVDEEFGKTMTTTMVKMETGPYYAIPQFPSVHHTMGGLKINTNAQVLTEDGSVIEGLYAAGEVTGGIHGTNRLGSNADADACTFGMVAGTYAATGVNPVEVK